MTFKKKIYVAAGYNTTFLGSGRKDFDSAHLTINYTDLLKETAVGTSSQLKNANFDEGVLGSFMSARFLKQANLPGFLPFMIPSLEGKPCTGVEGACGTGGRSIAAGVRSVLSELADSVFVAAFEMQNTMKAIYGADVLAGAAFYAGERKSGHAYFFPGIFSERAGAYYDQYGYDLARKGMAKWYELSILNARKNKKAQEYHNASPDLLALGMSAPDPSRFVPFLNYYDCSKISDGASSLAILSEKGLLASGIQENEVLEIIGMGESVGDITKKPQDLTALSITSLAVSKALSQANLKVQDISVLEIHDCFSITALLSFEALGLAKKGKGAEFILEGHTSVNGKIPTNLSGGLCGFGHPTGATGVRQMVDLLQQLTGKAENPHKRKSPYGMMISMGGNDKTVTCFIVKVGNE